MLYIIKNGSIEIGDEKRLSDNHYFFRLHSNVEGVDIIDYDKTDVVPLVKDILNRQNQFLEIKYLKILLIILFLVFAISIASFIFLTRQEKPTFENEKNEIITRIDKLSKVSQVEYVMPQEAVNKINTTNVKK